jgi:GDPmannose 4,6-dehydratase
MSKIALIVGVSGQDGAYLAHYLLGRGYTVWGTSRDVEGTAFEGLKRLNILNNIILRNMPTNDYSAVWQVFNEAKPDEIYNLAGQSSVGLSFAEPKNTIDSIFQATLNQLEVIRKLCPAAKFYNAGSGEVYGNTNGKPSDENAMFSPASPYAAAKASSALLVKLYRDCYDLFACTGILFNHESPLRPEHFVTRKITEFVRQLILDPSYKGGQLVLGDLSIMRDWGWAPEYVEAMWRMLHTDHPSDYVIATGVAQSLQDFTKAVFDTAGLDWQNYVVSDPSLFRLKDPSKTVGNSSQAREVLEWQPKIVGSEVAKKMYLNELF